MVNPESKGEEMLFIGESLNATIPSVNKAVLSHNEAFISELGCKQVESGADYIDLNSGTGGLGNEKEDLQWMVDIIQNKAGLEKPICLDSSVPEILMDVQKMCKQPPMYNSVCAGEKMKRMRSVLEQRECSVIAMTCGDHGIPATTEERYHYAAEIIAELRGIGMTDKNIFIDPIVMSVATDTLAAAVTLETITRVKEDFPDVNIVVAVSNIGFGLPQRKLVNLAYTAMCVQNGATALVADVGDRNLFAGALAAEALMNKDRFCKKYIKFHKKKVF